MMGLIGRKIGMTEIFDETGKQVPVTVIKVGPCTVLEVKNKDTHGYNAIKIGFEDIKESKLNSPKRGYFEGLKKLYKDINITPKSIIREFRINDNEINMKVGENIDLSIFEGTKFVDVVGKTKGRGFTGMVKRFNASRGRMSHGSKFHRGLGGTAMREHPGRVYPFKKMPGHYGNEQVTVQNLEIVKLIKDENIMLVKGAVPGGKNNLVLVKKAIKKNNK
ncbi:MAG: 50S ribosomal protein L3 [Exilispira sp.]